MANDPKAPTKSKQLSLDEYVKLKEKRAKSKLKLHFPLLIKIAMAIPFAYAIFLLVYYIVSLRFLAEH